MRKRMAIVAIALFAALAPAGAATSGETADEIIRKSVEAMGGEKNLRKVVDSVMRGSIKSGGLVGTIIVYSKAPNKIRVDFVIGAIKASEGFDGKIAWESYGNKVRQLTGEEAEYLKKDAYDSNDPLLRHKARGIKLELLGTRKARGRDAHVIDWKYPDGSSKKIFIDTQTYLVIGEERFRSSKSGKKTLEQFLYSDYKPVNGRTIPLKMTVINAYGKSEVIFGEAQNNTNLSLSLFQMPRPATS